MKQGNKSTYNVSISVIVWTANLQSSLVQARENFELVCQNHLVQNLLS